MKLLVILLATLVLQSAAPVSYVSPIDSEHSLLLIGGRKVDYAAMGEYGSNLIYPNPQEPLRLAISENSGATWELGDALAGAGESFVRVSRVDTHSIVLARTASDYGLART
ncbi:MAG: hypothetical protein DMG13_23620 [Acidobacteria bacterium]|nr:MAG: hypothetical protein DMG13_23620 [Acidobacteriota bacterium]